MPRILVVDDFADARLTLCMLLRLWGHEARDACDGPSALETARAFRPDVVLLDLAMPGMDGCEVARRLRRDPELGGAFLIAASGYGCEGDMALCGAAGFDAQMPKPVDLKRLEGLLASLHPRPLPPGPRQEAEAQRWADRAAS